MTKTRAALIAIVVALGAAFLGGYWPEHSQRTAAEARAGALEAQVESLQDRDRMAALLGSVLSAADAVAAMNYGDAQRLSSQFFDEVRAELGRTANPGFRSTLEKIMARRDQVTASLAQADRSALDPLRDSARELRRALGYDVP